MTVETATIHELDAVELLVDLPDAPLEYPEMGDVPLRVGDRGTVVFAYDDGRSFTVEFFRGGETVAITDVTAGQVRRVERDVESPDKEPGVRLEFAFLADSAQFLSSGRAQFNVVGGGLWNAETPKLPANYPRITVVVGVGYTREALDADHEVVVSFVNPDGARVGPMPNAHYEPSRTVTHPVSDARFEPESIVDVVHVPYDTPYFTAYGRYEFRIALDGREVKTLYFTLTRPAPEPQVVTHQ